MRRPAFAALAAWTMLVAATPAAAQTNAGLPERVTLEQVLQLLDQRSPGTSAERATIDVTAADRITAGTLPNPTLSYGGLRLVSGASTGAVTQHQFVVDQPLWLFGQRQARRQLADLNVAAEQASVSASLASRRLEVRQAFAELLARQEELRILQDSRTELTRIEQVVHARAEAGDRSQYDVLRLGTEVRMRDVDVSNAATEVEDAAGHLAALVGLTGWHPHAEGSLDAGSTPTDFNVLWESARRQRPSLLAAQQRQRAAQGSMAVALRERLPVPTISGGASTTRDVNGTSAFFGVSLPLPLFDRNRGAIARAAASSRAETLSADAEMAEAQVEIERARATLVSRRQTLAMVESDIVQRVPALRRMAEDAYREGRGSVLELLDASRSLQDIALLHVKQLELTKLAEEAVIAAAGLDVAVP